MLGIICVGLLAFAMVLMITAAGHAAAQAASAADLSALAGADAARELIPGNPCAVAATVAKVNLATLTECNRMGERGEIVQVSVNVPVSMVGWIPPLSVATGSARAGPPPQPWLGMD